MICTANKIRAATCEFQQCSSLTTVDSDEPLLPPLSLETPNDAQSVHYRPSICPCRIRVENALKTHVKRISFPTRISKIQSKPTIHMR